MLEQAVVLVGGKGTRLGSLTASTPKPLLQVAGKPFIEHLLQEISRFGFRRVTLLAGNLGQQFRDAYDGQTVSSLQVNVVVEERPLGTGGALRLAADSGNLDETFLLMNGDSWVDTDLTDLCRRWEGLRKSPGVKALVVLHEAHDTSRYGAVSIEDGLITSFNEKSASHVAVAGKINAGVYILDRSITTLVPPGEAVSFEAVLLPKLVERAEVAGLTVAKGTYFIDIGLPETFARSQAEIALHRRKPALFLDRDGTLNTDTGYTHRPSDLEWLPGAREAIKLANSRGYFVFVVTNQSGVARGLYQESDVASFHDEMQSQLFELGAHIDAFSYCPHHEDASVERYRGHCRRRKPAPGMIEDLAAVWPIDMEHSLMVGNADSDLQAGTAAGLQVLRYEGGSLLKLVESHVSARDMTCG